MGGQSTDQHVALQDLRWPGFDRHLETGTGFPEEVSDGYTQAVHAGV
jgi:hypothetical protein